MEKVIAVGPGQGSPSGFGLTHKLMADWYGGGLSVLEGTILPGDLIPPHTHTREDECSFVLSGNLMFEVGGSVVEAEAGTYVVKPRSVPHAFWNVSDEPARVMEMHSPGAFEVYYDEFLALEQKGLSGEEHMQAVSEIQSRYGVTFHWERIPELVQRYGLRPPGLPPAPNAQN